MGKQRTFKVGDTTYDVPEDKAEGFLSRKPDAIEVSSFIVDKDTFDVPLDKVEGFLSRKPNAKPLGEPVVAPAQPQEIPTITLDSTEVAEGTAKAPKPPTGPLKPGGGFTIGKTPTLTKQTEAPKPPTGPLKPGGGFTIGKTPTLTKQTKDVFVKNFLELPDNLKLDARNSGVFVNTFAKKMNLSPRELRQVANETVKTEMALKQLKTIYDQNPDDTDTLYKLAELHNNLGQHDLAYEAYAALEGKLKTIGEKEYADRISKEPVYTKPLPLNFVEQMPHANRLKSGNLRPDYVEQRQLPAVAGMAYTQELLGNKAEAQRLKGISESKGYKGQEFSSVGAGEALQPGNDMVYNDQGQMVPVGSPTPESEYLNGIAQAIENFTLFGPANEMTNVGFDKLAKNLPGAFDPYGLPSDKIAKTVGVITGAVETLMGVAGMTTPAGALFAMTLVQAQNIAPEQAKWMMPLGVVLNEYYRQQGEKMPEMMENVTVLADLGLLGFLTHQGVEGAKGLKAEIDLKKVFENLPPEAVEQLAKVGEKRIEMAQGDPKVYGEQMALRLDELKPQVEEIKMQAEAAKPVEPYNPPPHPESLRTVEEGASIVMNGEEGILERGNDGTWYHTTDKKSTQIKVEDKFNPTETLKELGIEVLAEITPEQVARAMADAEQVGRVEMNGKEYFVSLDRVGNENPTGDFVLEVKPDGTMINRFDSHPDPTFAKERKQKVINEFLKKNNLPPRKLTAKVEAKPVEEVVMETPVEEAGSVGVGGDVEATTKALEVANNKTPNLLRGIAFDNKSKATPVVKEVKIADILEENKDGQKLSDAIVNVRDGLVSKTQGDVMLYEDGSKFGVDDGFHRIAQAIINGDKTIKASVIESNAKSIAEAYHKAKADGTNPKLVKAVEQSLKETPKAVEQPSTLEIKPIENEKANQEGREKGLLDTPPLEQPLAPVAEKPTPNEPVSPAVEVQIEDFGVPKSDVTKVRELKPQLEVTPESIEIEAPDVESEFRKEPSEGNIGNDVDVRFADNVTIGAKYKLIEADDLQASHYTSGARNEKHGISQAQPKERNDLGSKAQQDKIAANPKFELVSEDNAAYSGAPIVNSRGEVIQGNNRSIGLKKHYQGGGTKYKGDLAANAEKYGFTKEQVEGMKNPVLVREITAQDNMAVRLGQFKATDLETGGKTRIDPITTSRKMSSQERGVLARLLVEGDYNSIKDAIRDNQKEIMKVLKKHLSPSEIKSMLKPGEDSFSATGMDDVAQVFSNLLFEGGDAVLPEIWDNLPARTRKNLEKALPEILETAQEKSILPAVQNVMMALHEWANSGIENFGEWKSQVDMFKGVKPDDIFTPFEMALGEKLANAKTQGEAKAIFQEYNELVSGTKETLFEQATEGKSMSDAVKELFNVELNEKDTQLQGERGVKATIPQEKPKTTTKTSKPQATGEGELTPDTPLKITSKEKALKAVDDLESFLLNLPGIKDNVGGERMGAPFSAEEAVKWFTKTLREGLDQGYKIKEAIERAIGKLGEHKTYSAYLDAVGEDVLRSYSLKQYEGQDINRPIETQFGASHASVAEVRKVMGIEDSVPISERVKRDVKTVMEEGRELASKIDLEELSDQVIYDGRSLNANEQAALVFRETELYNEIKDAENSLSKAVASGKKDAADLAQTRIDIAYKQQTAIMQALDIAGSEMGLAFRMRQVMNKRDYSLVSLEKRWTQASGGAKMPADVRKQFSDMVKDLEAKNKRYEELLEVKDKQLAEQALANIQESMGRSGKPTDKVKAGEKLRRLADRIEAGKISRLGGYKTSTGFDAVYDLSLTAVAETLRATGKLADAIESGIKKIRETDWYKDLADKNDFETKYREHLNKEYEKTDYDAPSMNEKGDLILDNQMLRDVVESLEVDSKLKQKNPQEFIDKVHEIVKEVFPDIERRKVQDAISGYGKKINSSLDDLQREVNSLKRDLKGISGLEDAKAGKGVLKSGYSPPKPTPMQREQQREIHKELKNHPQDQASLDKKWATALDRTKSALKNSITDLRKRIEDIKAGTATPKTPREKLKLDNEAEMMQEVVDDLEQQLIDLEGKKTLSIEQRIDMAIQGAERTRELYERRTKEIRDTGTYTRDTPVELSSPELTIARQIRDAAKAVYEATRDASPGEKSIAEQTKAARDLRASEDRVKDLENKIKKNQIGYAAKAQMAAFKTPELIASLAKEKALNEVINTMREEQGLVEAHARDLWKARKQRQIAEIERRIREKDYTKKVKPELELDIEMERIQAEMDRKKFDLDVEIEKEKYRNLSGRDKRYEMWLDIVNAPKSLMASMDFSAPLRQGAILSSRHPLLAAKTFKNMFKHWASEEYATNWHSELVRSDGYIRAKKSNLFISEPMARLVAAEERFSSNIAEKIPVWGRGVKASNRAYSGFLNELRMEVFNQHYEALQRNGFKGKQMQKELDAMAYLINNFTGRGSLGKAEIAAPLANSFFFAPRFVASRFNTLYNSLFGYTIPRAKGGGRLITPRARIEAYKAVGSYITAGMSVIAMAKAAGADVEIDPRSSDFGKIKIGDTRYDIWAGHQQIVVLLSKIAMQASKSPRTGKVTEFGENDNAAYTTLRFLRTKLSPPVGALVSAGMKKNVDGTPFTAQGAAWDMITPLIFSDMKSMYEEEGAVGVLRSAVPATFGVGVNTFEKDAIIKQSNLDKSSEKLMLERKYQPEKANDDEVYVKGKPYIIPEDKMVKIKEMRAKEAGKLIELHYWKLKKLTPEEYESKVNSYYNEGLKKARNKYLPSGWKNTK